MQMTMYFLNIICFRVSEKKSKFEKIIVKRIFILEVNKLIFFISENLIEKYFSWTNVSFHIEKQIVSFTFEVIE